MSRQLPIPHEQGEAGIIIKVFLVNGESRSLRIYNWYTVTVSLNCVRWLTYHPIPCPAPPHLFLLSWVAMEVQDIWPCFKIHRRQNMGQMVFLKSGVFAFKYWIGWGGGILEGRARKGRREGQGYEGGFGAVHCEIVCLCVCGGGGGGGGGGGRIQKKCTSHSPTHLLQSS